MATTTPTTQSVINTLLTELLNGQLSDETIAAVDRIQRSDVPEPLRDVVGFMHGMSTMPQLRDSIINSLLVELASGCEEFAKQRAANVPPDSF
jgi:hypothetical protein